MKLLYLTDTHIRGTSPRNRLDDFPKTLKTKLEEVVNIIEEEKVDLVLHGGDLFDRPDVSISVVSDFVKILSQIDVPIYMISGNHDVFGHNPDTINRTILGLLTELDLIHLVEAGQRYIIEKDVTLQITGQGYIYDIDDKNKEAYYMVDSVDDRADYSIHMTHGMLLDRPFIKGVPQTLIDDIKDTKADITLGGHYHSGYRTVEIDNKYFLNPGSLVRISNTKAELVRKPQVILIELDDEINIKYLPLRSAKPGDEVLDRRVVEDNIYKRERMFEFKQNIDAAVDFDKMDINDILIEVSSSEGVDDSVKEEALRRVSQIQMKNILGD